MRVKYNTENGEILSVDGRWFTEASTESLTWEVLERRYDDEWLNIREFEPKFKSYKDYIDVIDEIEKSDKDVKKADFWRAMLIRKRANGKNVEKNTPLLELIKKINWRDSSTNKDKRPWYYTLIMNALDFVEDDRQRWWNLNTGFILKFIKSKNINDLKNWIPAGKNLSDMFDKSLLTKDGKDFKKEILDAYAGR